MLVAAKFGWMLDAMDFMLYAMAVGQLRSYFGFGDATAGLLGTVTLVMSGVGGAIFGYVADRFGRTRALMGTIAHLLARLARRRDVAERDAAAALARAARHRHGRRVGVGRRARQRDLAARAPQQGDQHHAVGLGARLHPASLLAAQRSSARRRSARDGWRWLFVARRPAGALHAVDSPLRARAGDVDAADATARTRGAESVPRDLRAGAHRPHAAHHRCSAPRCSLPTGASSSGCRRFSRGPSSRAAPAWASSARCGWIIPVQLGAYCGYLTFGFIADRIGRRRAFVLFMVGAAVLVPIYGQMARSPLVLLLLGPLLGYFGNGYFSMFGGFVAELFPAAVRATGQGTSYNIGRMAGADRAVHDRRASRRCPASASAWRSASRRPSSCSPLHLSSRCPIAAGRPWTR